MSCNAITIFLLLLNISLFPAISALNQEGFSLLSWLSTFNSSPSATFFSSWDPTDQNPCQWDHIRCNNNEFISEIAISSISLGNNFPTQFLTFHFLTTLVLSNGNLTGEIPFSIGNLSLLNTLDLSINSLTGRIPQEIGKLSQLQVLSLSSNSLQGGIPAEIGNCSRLQQLELFDNMLSGRIPAEIGKLWALEIFRTGGNPGIHGEIPMQISQCKELAFLGLADTGISGQIPFSIGELKNLKTLSVYTANLTGEIPPEIGNCSALENLFAYENQISGVIPSELGLLGNLEKVLLWKNELSGRIPGSLGNCLGLTVIDFSLNSLTGSIPPSLASLGALEELLLSENNLSGEIPPFIGSFSRLKQLELDNNRFSGQIPPAIGELKDLSLFFAWQNRLQGIIPLELANCKNLQAIDLSHNSLTGSVPKSLFDLKNLTKLLLLSNLLSGGIPAAIGNCTGLTRLRLGSNMLFGQIPPEIGLLKNLSFLELSENQFTGEIPPEIGNCTQLEMVDLRDNKLQGMIPITFQSLVELNVLDLSRNRISGTIPQDFRKLKSLNKLVLSGNNITGSIPESLGLCKDLQLLDMSSNRISSSIPDDIGELQGLDILMNLSWNFLRGPIPESFSSLSNLANLDLSHNMLTGSLSVLGNLDNLASLNVSYNGFSGFLPDTKFFHDLPDTVFVGNPDLCINKSECKLSTSLHNRRSSRNLVIRVVLGITATMIIVTIGVISLIKAQGSNFRRDDEEQCLEWEITPFQKISFSVNDIVTKLLDSNIVGKGASGVVYRVETPLRQVIAVKKLWPKKTDEVPERDWFSAEVTTLGSIRHKNIVRLLGCCTNGKTRLLLFDYISNGSLSGLLHERTVFLDWDARYKIILGVAHGLAYLHHDCIPPIVHRDVKANNILVGPQFEAFLADFGLAKLINSSNYSRVSNSVAGSYGYIAPEYGYSLKITEKSDVYSYGIVLLEVLTGMEPADCRIPDGVHIVSWVNQELREKRREFTSILDQQLLQRSGTQIQEMLQVLGVALLCVNPCPEERPTMKDVTAMLKEIKHENDEFEKPNSNGKGSLPNPKAAVHCSSFSRSSEPLIRSPSNLP
ncbi:LRR receptor-like serine/threonine-protein kinase RGI2 isoform X1 [Actinidia eriantha]|uniref:LRR receptor-like serine/threonine-protein kinase RGI2 isoform X1 n=1 Tax=Actinidia eriantha TaxID=165200 RepID=UPI0025881791|nr:LRR receptor-like serine/threonine-protein kinase RGI2 isoform X1 [Actinidia eriantha]